MLRKTFYLRHPVILPKAEIALHVLIKESIFVFRWRVWWGLGTTVDRGPVRSFGGFPSFRFKKRTAPLSVAVPPDGWLLIGSCIHMQTICTRTVTQKQYYDDKQKNHIRGPWLP